jgi:hypothetical protein
MTFGFSRINEHCIIFGINITQSCCSKLSVKISEIVTVQNSPSASTLQFSTHLKYNPRCQEWKAFWPSFNIRCLKYNLSKYIKQIDFCYDSVAIQYKHKQTMGLQSCDSRLLTKPLKLTWHFGITGFFFYFGHHPVF